MVNSRWRVTTALGIVGVVETFLLLAGRMWFVPLLNTTLSSLATAVGQTRTGSGVLIHVLWLALIPLACGALSASLVRIRRVWKLALLAGAVGGAASLVVDRQPGAALVSAVMGGVGAWLVTVLSRGWLKHLGGGLRWITGVLGGNVVGLLALGGGLPTVARALTQTLDLSPGMTAGLPVALLLTLLAPLIAGAISAWGAGRSRGPRAALAGALSGLYALYALGPGVAISTASLAGGVIATLVMAGGAAGGLAARRVRSEERAWPYLLVGAVTGSGLMVLLVVGALVVASPLVFNALGAANAAEPSAEVDTLGLVALALAVAAPIVGGVTSAAIARRAYIRAALLSCVLPALAMMVLVLSGGGEWFVLLPVGVAVLCAGLGGLLVRLCTALKRRITSPCGEHRFAFDRAAGALDLSIGIRLVMVGILVATAILYSDCFPLPAQPVAARVVTPDQAKAFWASYRPTLALAATLAPTDLVQAYQRPYRDQIDFDPAQATFYELVDGSLMLTPAQKELLHTNGFVAMAQPVYESFGSAYEDIYRRDLPVFVTTDSILHVLHKSYDDILADVERQVIIPELSGLLDSLEAQVGQRYLTETDSRLRSLLGELYRYLRVARALLADTPPAGDAEAAVWFKQAREGMGVELVNFFSESRLVDWTHFQPAGRYAESAQMGAYFRAMRWLGMMDWRLMTTDPETMETSFHPDQTAAALLLMDAVDGAQMMGRWQELDGWLTLFAGMPDGVDMPALQALWADANLGRPGDVFDPAVQARLFDLLQSNLYGVQQINNAVLVSDPLDPEPSSLPVSFALFQPRYTVDSHVFTNVVFDRVVYDGEKIMRAFPSPLDALFVLGNDYAATLLKDELGHYNYQGNLLAQRALVDGYDPSVWTESLYGMWVQALRTLNDDTTAAPYPQVMQTAAWAAKATHTQLFSWAQLRHDSALYVKQPVTVMALCDYPAGYVEPYPPFYGTVAEWARRGRAGLQERHWSPQTLPLRDRILDYLNRLEATASRLEGLAQKELDGWPFTAEEEQFLRQVIVIQRQPGCMPVVAGYEGWYPQLFYAGPDQSDEPDPTVAPVHTNLDPVIGPTGVLHVATGYARLMVVAADSGPDRAVYVGPVGSYFEFIEPHGTVLTDAMWEGRLSQNPPSPPRWWVQYTR